MALKTEYKAGPLTINLRILLEPKGFLRLVMAFIAILAFATTAGFNSSSQGNSIQCTATPNISAPPVNYTAYLTFRYPYMRFNYDFTVDPAAPNMTACDNVELRTLPLSGSSQFFVAVGVLTLIYVLGATLVYILFITPELFLAKWLVIGDFFLTIVFGVFYVLAAIAWSAGSHQLQGYVGDRLRAFGDECVRCDVTAVSTAVQVQPFTQSIVSLLLGWLTAFIWFASVWFVYKDTQWHKDSTGPLAKLYEVTGAKKTEEAGGEGAEAKQPEDDQ